MSEPSGSVPTASSSAPPGRPLWGSFVGGDFVDDPSPETFEVIEAATGRPLATVVSASAETVDAAVVDARRAYDEVWRWMAPKERGALMRQVAARIRDNAAEIAELCAREVGKPVRDALRVDVLSCHSSFDYYARHRRVGPRRDP